MPRGDMTRFSLAHPLRRYVLFLALAALIGCADRGNTVPEAADRSLQTRQTLGGPQGVPASPAPSSPGQAASKQASGSAHAGAADTADRSAASARIYKGSGVLLKPSPPEKPSAEPTDVSLNFEAADVRDIAKTVLAEILKESYIVDPRVQGTVSFRTTRPLPRSALLPTLETVLRMNGIVLVKESGIFKIMPAAAVRGSL